eukprot:2004720-Pyramimonas_sp.AAC.2
MNLQRGALASGASPSAAATPPPPPPGYGTPSSTGMASQFGYPGGIDTGAPAIVAGQSQSTPPDCHAEDAPATLEDLVGTRRWQWRCPPATRCDTYTPHASDPLAPRRPGPPSTSDLRRQRVDK